MQNQLQNPLLARRILGYSHQLPADPVALEIRFDGDLSDFPELGRFAQFPNRESTCQHSIHIGEQMEILRLLFEILRRKEKPERQPEDLSPQAQPLFENLIGLPDPDRFQESGAYPAKNQWAWQNSSNRSRPFLITSRLVA